MTILALQKPHKISKAKDHVACLGKHLKNWLEGSIEDLLEEGRTIKTHLQKGRAGSTNERADPSIDSACSSFARLMFEGKCGAALNMLSNESSGWVFNGNDVIVSRDTSETMKEILKNKHNRAQPLIQYAISDSIHSLHAVHPVMFWLYRCRLIRYAAKLTEGTTDPSGVDAHGWKRMCCAFKSASSYLCHSLAPLTKCLCTTHVHPTGLASLLACRLIAIDKCPGVRPIGISEVVRRIVSKAILFVITWHPGCCGIVPTLWRRNRGRSTCNERPIWKGWYGRAPAGGPSNTFQQPEPYECPCEHPISVPHLQLLQLTPTVRARPFSWVMTLSSPEKEQHREIPCYCMPWPPDH